MNNILFTILILVLASFLLFGCGEKDIHTYETIKTIELINDNKDDIQKIEHLSLFYLNYCKYLYSTKKPPVEENNNSNENIEDCVNRNMKLYLEEYNNLNNND